MRRVRLLRENGGHGDVIRCLGVARSLKAVDPSIEVWFYTMGFFRTHADMCPDVDVVVPVTKDERRPRGDDVDPDRYPYLRSDLDFDASVSLCCPAWDYELKNAPNVEKDRIQLWTEAAARATGLKLEPMVPRINLPPNHRAHSRMILKRLGLKFGHGGKPLVVLAPAGTHCYRRMTDVQVSGLCRLLTASGMDVLILSITPSHWKEVARADGCCSISLPTIESIYGVIELADLVISVDTGALHFAAVMGTPTVGLFGCTGGQALCRRYPMHSPIDPEESDKMGLTCKKPCYYVRFREQQQKCRAAERCLAMAAIEPDRIARRAIEALVVRR